MLSSLRRVKDEAVVTNHVSTGLQAGQCFRPAEAGACLSLSKKAASFTASKEM